MKLSFLFWTLGLALLLSEVVSAVTLDTGTLINTSISNTSISFDSSAVFTDLLTVDKIAVGFLNFSFISGSLIVNSTGVLNFTNINTHVDSRYILYLTNDRDDIKKIASNATNNVNGTFKFNIGNQGKNCGQISKITETSNSGNYTQPHFSGTGSFTCLNNAVTIDLENIEYSGNSHTISINYEGDNICDSWEDSSSIDCVATGSQVPGSGGGGGGPITPLNETNPIIDLTGKATEFINKNILQKIKDFILKYPLIFLSIILLIIFVDIIERKNKKRNIFD